jgi:Family of unknown function (DUF6328)
MDPRSGREPYSRHETEAQRLDRNYLELLQELRVAETGVQILFAFLLSIAFQQRFNEIDDFQRTVYLVTLGCAAVSGLLLIAPAAAHRLLFRRRLKDELVTYTGRVAAGGLVFLLLAIIGSVLLIVDFVSGMPAAVTCVVIVSAVGIWFWGVVPARWRAWTEPVDDSDDDTREPPR